MGRKWTLTFETESKCSVTRARAGKLNLTRGIVHTPVFMPVGTQGTMKGVTVDQMNELGKKMIFWLTPRQNHFSASFQIKPFSNLEIEIILTNTYHLAHQPGTDVLDHFGGVHKFMKWEKPILTDSGGFQMVSLVHLSTVECLKAIS